MVVVWLFALLAFRFLGGRVWWSFEALSVTSGVRGGRFNVQGTSCTFVWWCRMFIVMILDGQGERLVICGSVRPVGVAIVLFVFVAAGRPLEART